MNLDKQKFTASFVGKPTGLYFLKNGNLFVAITNYGARIVSIIFNDKESKETDIVTGFDSIDNYLNAKEPYHGAIVGRYANRIAGGRFLLNGRKYQLAVNNPPNHLHGGPGGFHNQVWDVEDVQATNLQLGYLSRDGEEGYPGNLKVQISYSLTGKNELIIRYRAETDETTIINLTSHPFFNLNGQGKTSVLNHRLQVNADNYTPVDANLIPTGIAPVENTPFDFRMIKPIGKEINEVNEQLKYGSGYDHNFVLNGKGLRQAARAVGDQSGIVMDVMTDQPGMQLYTGNFMKGEHRIKYGLRDDFRTAFCLETQHYPDSPNHPGFPSTILEPGVLFQSTTIYKFSLEG